MAGVGVRLHRADEEVGADPVGDEGLRAVDDVAAIDPLCRRAKRGDVRPRTRLGDPERADLLAGDRRPQEPLVLVRRSELPDRWGGDAGVRAQAGAHAAARTGRRELLGPYSVVDVVAALPAE
jgi:hypothetical protein